MTPREEIEFMKKCAAEAKAESEAFDRALNRSIRRSGILTAVCFAVFIIGSGCLIGWF